MTVEHEAETNGGAVLLVRLGEGSFGLPLAAVERVLPMAAILPLPDTGSGLLGMLNLHGEILPVVDPRPRLGLPSPRVAPEQRLVKMRANVPFLLWVDGVAEVIEEANALSSVPAQHANPIVPRVMRLGDAMIPMLGPAALEPRGFGR